MKNRLLFDFIKKYYGQVKYTLLFMLLILPVTSFISQLAPWYVSKIITLINLNEPSDEIWQKLIAMFVVIAVLPVISTLISLFVMFLLQKKIASPLGLRIRRDLFAQALGQHGRFWSKYNAGTVFSKIDNTRRFIAAWGSLGDFLLFFYTSVWTLIIILFLLARINLSFASAYLCGTLILFAVFHKVSSSTFKVSAQQENFMNKIFGRTVNMVGNYFLLKIFASVARESEKLDKDYTTVCKAMQKNAWLRNRNQLFLSISVVLFECLMIVYAVLLWTKGVIQVGNIVYILNAVMPLGGIVANLAGFWMLNRAHLYKVQNNLTMLAEMPEIKDADNAKQLTVSTGKIEFKGVNFSYNDAGRVISDLTLTVNGGEKVGIVGVSGGGKTTLLHLLQRLLPTPEKSIYIDGQDITKVTQNSLHDAIAFIPQDTSLFHRTLSENISYGSFNATEEQIAEASRKAFVDEFAEELPEKYQTLVGDKGVKLSGGQRQRAGIARAVLKDCKILLLDEATSALDSRSEKYIQESLQNLIKGKTVIAVAHRLSTLENMDRIVVIDNGSIIEEGRPEQLLRQQGKYAKLWNLQA